MKDKMIEAIFEDTMRAIERIRARQPLSTGTNYHLDLDTTAGAIIAYKTALTDSQKEVERLRETLKDTNNLINSGYCKDCDSATLIRHHLEPALVKK